MVAHPMTFGKLQPEWLVFDCQRQDCVHPPRWSG